MAYSPTETRVCHPQPTWRSSFWSLLTGLGQVHRQRRHLAQLETLLLRDVGLTDADVQRELQKSPWDAPEFWRN